MLKEQGREENQVRSPRLLLWPDFGSPHHHESFTDHPPRELGGVLPRGADAVPSPGLMNTSPHL